MSNSPPTIVKPRVSITVEYLPLLPHQRTGGPSLPWLGTTSIFNVSDPIPEGLDASGRDSDGNRREYWADDTPDHTGTCRAATLHEAIRLCTNGIIGQIATAIAPPDA